VATVHEPGPPYSRAGPPHDTSTSIRGWPPHYTIVHPLSMVGCRPTQQLSNLLSLWDPIILYVSVHSQSCSPRVDDRSSINTGGGYHLRSSEHENRPLSTFPSGILHFPLVALPGLTLSHKSDHYINHIEPPS
jgi:hypothetical protein